ncbi:CRISPR-associated helicase/endonuclease Cas3 [Clostridium saccharoperbutylacetonicum]|uniref:CRISPR-associated helicase/endonuclease Cas3 n=1 Tax=Clostridium saccharoperbutylacetonicum TaxID=36745 RepID=UPI000983E664|nr:CRISPR-associated helicase/endonuclease Cas3 [Clostridium saccharoperbutylacetonicum]AQR96104.1 CRISPR-associated nuclease/helicase Cas3 [Clostridium saccharoperbutylacetonicum]NSB31973.1 CRISPR-associated endonuclease/helicase Cas3 [Clostridium saccharoperbutylacetonicum]
MDLSLYKAKPDKTIREHTDELLKNLDILQSLNYIKNQHIYELTQISCEYHDYGKANREFQKRIKNNTRFNENIEIAHNVLSLYFIDKNKFENIEDYYKVAFAVLNHHNYCDNLRTLENNESKELIKSLLIDFEINDVRRSTIINLKKVTKNEEAILIKGFLHKCDYSASGGIPIEYENNLLNCGLDNLLEKWRKKNSNSNWNELQQFCKQNTNKNIMVVAQTGMGKTEAGLHWIGNNKGFFILPLKTAINSIYKRVKEDILEENHIESKLALLHSDALSYYNNDKNEEMDIMDYYNQSKQLSVPLSISTLDQLFDFVFKYQGYEFKLATLSYSKMVIDEIQMYGADLLAYLIYGMKTVNKFGGKIAILTATLAPFIKDLLKTGDSPIEFKEKTFINDIKRHNVKVYHSQINSEIIYSKFLENTKLGISNKILVVCNTVRKAQQIYTELLEKGISNINILHSKFIKCERAAKETEIFEFGKTKNIRTGIWISTQIVEASLDIDFDYLFTELSDISGLFQRLGRCNRKGVKPIDKPNCFVFLDIDHNILTNGTKGFIDSKIYELSKKALKDVTGLLSESDKIDIINKYLTTENLEGSDYLINYRKFSKWIEELEPYEMDKDDINLRNIISYDVIPNEIYKEHQEEIDDNSRKLLKVINQKLEKKELEKIKLEKIKLKEDIKKYTVPVGRYDIYFKGNNAIVKKIQLSKNEFVNVVDCKYNELGFIRLTSEEVKGIEENFDNFM